MKRSVAHMLRTLRYVSLSVPTRTSGRASLIGKLQVTLVSLQQGCHTAICGLGAIHGSFALL